MRPNSGSKPSADGDSTSDERARSVVDALVALFAVLLVVVFGAVVIYGGTTLSPSPSPQATPGEPSLDSLLQESEGVPDVPKKHPKADIHDVTRVERLVASYINAERIAYGSEAVVYNPELADIARYHSYDMWDRGYSGHIAPNGSDSSGRLQRYGYICPVGSENISILGYKYPIPSKPYGSVTPNTPHELAKTITRGWMYSAPHRWGLLDGRTDVIGIGIHVDSRNTVRVTMLACSSTNIDKSVNGNMTANIASNQTVIGKSLNGTQLPPYPDSLDMPPEDEPNDGDGSHTTPTTRERVA